MVAFNLKEHELVEERGEPKPYRRTVRAPTQGGATVVLADVLLGTTFTRTYDVPHDGLDVLPEYGAEIGGPDVTGEPLGRPVVIGMTFGRGASPDLRRVVITYFKALPFKEKGVADGIL